MKRLLMLLAVVAACGGEHRPAREKFNAGVAALAQGDFDGATKNLLAARGEAGVDPELRYRAAYDLGVAFAALADKSRRGEQKDLQKALEQAEQSLSWFSDAARQKPNDAEALANQSIMRVRVQAITDELRKAEGKLEARLDASVKDQRALLDGVQQAWLAVQKSGGNDPLAQQGALSALADRERGIVAEVGAISDLAADEIDEIGKKADDKRSDEEKVRVVQLKNLDIYLLEARARIAEARRKLQDLDGETAVGRADAALVSLKRAREQLLDPITVMKGLAGDELELARATAEANGPAENPLALGSAAPVDPTKPRPWLEPAVLADRQNGLHDRLEEVRARFEAAVTPPPPDQTPAQPDDPKQAKMKERVTKALPFVIDASGAMDRARQSLVDRQFTPGLEQERASLEAIARAIEEFSDLKQTVELAHTEEEQIGALLSPEAAKQLPADQRATETKAALARNVARLTRLQGLIADELADTTAKAEAAAAQAAQAPAQGSAAPPGQPPAPSKEEIDKQLAAVKEKYAKAEELRGEAQTALTALDTALATAGDPQAPNTEATAKLQDLRMLFFTLIEHLEQLIRDQGETRDRTTQLQAADDTERKGKLPEVMTREDQHTGMAQAITDELAKEADAAAKQPQPQPGQPDAKALAGAAAEVREAIKAMGDAKTGMTKVQAATGTSESLQPALTGEGTAIEHLEAALKLLQPPKQNQNQDDKQNQDQQKQPQPQPKPQDQQAQQKPGGAGQAARDQDANQQRKRRDQPSDSDPVDKDW